MASVDGAANVEGQKYEWKTEHYFSQKKKFWPKTGKHILAQYDDETVVVYQAYKPSIAEYAVKNQRWD